MKPSPEYPKLEEQVAVLYRIFAKYHLLSDFPSRCSILGRQEDAKALADCYLREADPDMIALYCFRAGTTMGDDLDFRHFLPRMLECMAYEREWNLNETRFFEKLVKMNWNAWPVEDRTAIRDFLRALWKYILTQYPWDIPAMEFLMDAAEAGEELVADLLDIWEAAESEPALRHLAAAAVSKFAIRSTPAEELIRSRVYSQATLQRLERAVFDAEDGALAREFSDAHAALEWELS